MSTTTIDERLVAAREDQVVFMCRRSDLRLVKTPIYPIYGPGGRIQGDQPGETVAFRDGVLRVPLTGDVQIEAGRKINASDLVSWLEKHRLFQDREDGFWRVDPTAPPVSREELDALTKVVLEFDEDRLVELIAQERAGWAREDLLGAAETALERMRALKVQAEAEAEKDAKGK